MASLPTVVPLSVPAKRLAASIGPTATTFQVSDILAWDDVSLTAADFGEVAYGAFRDANGTVLELFSFDPTTIASASITFVKRGLDFSGDRTTEVTANKLTWIKGTTLVELGASFPQLYQYFIDYANNLAIQGAVDASTSVKGIGRVSVAPVSPSTPIFVGTNDPRVPGNDYGVDAGSNDTYVVTLTTAPAAYVAGQAYSFKAATINTGPATVNFNTLGAKSILRPDGSALANGDIPAGAIVELRYDGVNMRIVGTSVPAPTRQTFAAGGTWTKPAGLKYIEVTVIGGGSSGGGANGGGGGLTAKGAGGSGGGISRKRILTAALGATETVTVGAANGTSSFGTHASATGATNATTVVPGAPGIGSLGDFNYSGQPGEAGSINVAGANASAAAGAGNYLGGGALGPSTTANGNAAITPGTGGSGAFSTANGAQTGGAGAAGIVIVEEFY